MEGVYELHWQRREYGELSLQLFARCENGQLRMVDSFDAAPFDGPGETAKWLGRALYRDSVVTIR